MSRAPKAVHHELIDRDNRPDLYEQFDALVAAHHPELVAAGCRIALAWHTGWKPDGDGKIILGRCKRLTDLERELAPYDFVISLLRDFWESNDVTDTQRTALLDHELCHADVAYGEDGEVRLDERDRPVYRTRKHDVEEFWAIAERYGIWKRDLEILAEALRDRVETIPPDAPDARQDVTDPADALPVVPDGGPLESPLKHVADSVGERTAKVMAYSQTVRCDCCRRVHDLQYGDPVGWFEIRLLGPIPMGERWPRHACSVECLRAINPPADAHPRPSL